MFKCSIIPNKVILRTLKSATSPAVVNKPKKTWWSNDYINYPFFFSFDRPDQYIDLNSRLITVEGNIGVGKGKVARKVADYFALRLIEDVTEDEMHVVRLSDKMQLDMRLYNAILPRECKTYTREMLFTDENPVKYGKPLLLQLHHYYWRFFKVCVGMAHLLNLGTGMVCDRSPWSDNVMALTLKECGFLSGTAYKFYNMVRCESIPTLWRPNIIIYLKASPEMIRSKLKEKKGWEQNACNLSDKFIEVYTQQLEKYLAEASLFSKVFTIDYNDYDVDNEDDFSALMESMAKLNCEFKEIDEFDTMFIDWSNGTHCRDALDVSRFLFSSAKKCYNKSFTPVRIPHVLREGSYNEDELEKIHAILQRDERFIKTPAFDPKYESWLSIMFKKPQFNYNNLDHQPMSQILRSWY